MKSPFDASGALGYGVQTVIQSVAQNDVRLSQSALARAARSLRQDRGFSLIELLVVIGVIAVLLGILLPVIGKAREAGNRLACMSNLHQISVAFTALLGDSDGFYPRPAANEQDPNDWIYYEPGRNQNQGRIVKYLGGTFNAKVFRCPSDDVSSHAAGKPPYSYSYTVNETICRTVKLSVGKTGQPGYHFGGVPLLNVSRILRPSEIIFVIDESSATIDDGCWAPQNYDPTLAMPLNLLANRHDLRGEHPTDANPSAGRGNVAFCDGHVDFIERSLCVNPRYWDAPWDGSSLPAP